MAIYLALIVAFSLAPLVVVLGVSLTPGEFLVFPPHGLSLRWYAEIARHPDVIAAFTNSLVIAAVTVVMATILSLGAAYALVRYRWRLRGALESFLQSPLLLPTIVVGLALSQYFTLVRWLQTPEQIVLGHLIIAFPYILRTIVASLLGIDVSIEEAAWTLGATPLRATWHILLPLARPGIVAGALFVFITSFDNITVSLWLVGPHFNTFPMWLFSYIQNSSDPLPAAVASASAILTIAAVLILERLVGLQRQLGAAG